MADSFSPATGADQSVPTGQDKYDVAPPNYRQIGQALAAGQDDYNSQKKASTSTLSQLIAGAIDAILSVAAQVVAAVLSWLLCIVAYLMRIITSIDDGAAPGMAAVVKNSLGHVFGLDTGSTGRKIGKDVSGDVMGTAIGKMILNSLKSGVPASAGKTLQPDDTAASNFLSMLAKLGVEGWMDGFIAEAIGGGHFASVLELVPIMNEVLGLGRLSRRALAPLVKILVADPYTWKLHQDYRPALWSESLAIKQLLTGKWDADALDKELGKHGHSPDIITAMIAHARPAFSDADFEYLVAHGYQSKEQYTDRLKALGWKDTDLLNQAQMPETRVINANAAKRWEMFVEAYLRGDIDEDRLTAEANLLSFSQPIKDQMASDAVMRRQLSPKHLTLGEVQAMIKAHVMSLDDLRTWMTRMNYPPDEEALLEIYLMGQITTADEAAGAKRQKAKDAQTAAEARAAKQQQAAADAAAKAATKGLSIATFESLVENHLRSFDEFKAFLKELNIPPASITALVELLHEKIDTKEATAAAHEALAAAAAIKHLPLSQIEAAVIAGTIPISDLAQFMTQQKFAQTDIDTALTYVQGKLDDATAKAAAAEAAKAAAAVKGISLPNLERAARLGLVAPADYSAALTSAGFDAHSVDLMAGILSSQMAADQHTIEQRAAAAAAAAKKNISLPALERAVIAGLQPIGAYQAQLVALGYDAGDVATLVGLLQLQVDTAADVATKKAAAAAKLGVKNLSLAEIERAVRLGVLSVDQYRADLAGIGFAPADVAILAASILAELAATKAAEAKQAAIAAALKNKGVSLAQEQQLVKDGISTLDAYTAFLRTQGYSDTVAAQLTQLLGDQMDQAALAAQKHADAAARAAEKDISLASEEKAVIDGIRTLDDYDALLVKLGFNETDQATLIALLELRMPAPEVTAA
jgi:hypothetical protein